MTINITSKKAEVDMGISASSSYFNLLFTITLLLMLGKNIHRVECGQNYREALAKSLLFFQGQRSGKIPSSQKITWRFSSALSDGLLAKVPKFHILSKL